MGFNLGLILEVTVAIAVIAVISLCMFSWRVVVNTSKVHIVQSSKKTTSFGAGMPAGNAYYYVPRFVPLFGLTRTILPINNFDLSLHDYASYDKDRVPFKLDVVAFFRIVDTNLAASRISDFEQLKEQLTAVEQGAIRKVLSSNDINTIMTDRAVFGEQFTNEVKEQLQNWGVAPVKNLELMDIRDAENSKVIANIMAKKVSHIEMESRTEVAKNQQLASVAETEAEQIVSVRQQEMAQQVGMRQAEAQREVGIANQKAEQAIQEEAANTTQKKMEVLSVETQRKAEIARAAAQVLADQTKSVAIVNAEGSKASTILAAEATLEQQKRIAEGTQAVGLAKAEAEKALQLAPVAAQITLAKEIGSNEGYQHYLVSLRKIEAEQAVGTVQAEALRVANIKIIANTGSASSGIASIGDVLTSKGGTQLGALVEGFANTPAGEAIMKSVGIRPNGSSAD